MGEYTIRTGTVICVGIKWAVGVVAWGQAVQWQAVQYVVIGKVRSSTVIGWLAVQAIMTTGINRPPGGHVGWWVASMGQWAKWQAKKVGQVTQRYWNATSTTVVRRPIKVNGRMHGVVQCWRRHAQQSR